MIKPSFFLFLPILFWATLPVSAQNYLGNTDRLYPQAADAHVVIWRDGDGIYHATGRRGPISQGDDFIDVATAAFRSLTPDRTWMEKVLVATDVEIGPAPEIRRVRIPGYTIFDVAGTIHVSDTSGHIIPIHASNASHIEVPRARVTGTPRFGALFNSVSHLRLGEIYMDVRSPGVRIDRSGRGRGNDIQVDRLYVTMDHQGGHAFETYGVDRLQVGQVMGYNTAGCVVLLNDTTDATVGSVVGHGTSAGGGYATFRLANDNDNISVGQVVARGGGRGVFILSGTKNVNVNSVNLIGQEREGIFIEDAQNVRIGGGIIGNTNGVGVLVNSRNPGQGPGPDHLPAEGIVITNVRIYDDREAPRMAWAIEELGPNTRYNRYIDNDLRGAGTQGGIKIFADTSVVRDNLGAGIYSGRVTLRTGQQPAACVEGVSPHAAATPSLRARLVEAPTGGSLAWHHYFEYDAEKNRWNLLVGWRRDPGRDIDLEYWVDQN